MLRTQDTIAVCDIETGELLPFSVPTDFFTDPSNQNARLCLGIAPANTPQPTHTAEDCRGRRAGGVDAGWEQVGLHC